ncbi:nucleotidyltransferase domain-containing protein [bacterium]|nr:nucleotidyltransferase domain-containing protein [bacterium]
MTINIDEWLNLAIEKLQKVFKEKLLFVGLQGSYNRGEATDESDIDLVVVLDELSIEDLKEYRKIINEMPNNELACGFISGKKELQNWSKADLFQFFYDTKSLVGNLEDIIQPPSIEDIKKSIKTSSETLYHAAVHSFVHSANYAEDLQNLYKMTFFILQAKYFIENNIYVKTKNELAECLDGTDKEILDICINKKQIDSTNKIAIESLYKKLIDWTSQNI